MANQGIKIYKANTPQNNKQPKNRFLNSENILLKIHKQGAFKFLVFRTTGQTVTVRFDDLGYRPLVLVYCQRFTHDSPHPLVDTNYHLLDWSYFGATKQGECKVQVYNNRFVLTYSDMIVDDDGAVNSTLFGYYYIFKESIDG